MQKQGTVIRWDATRAFGFIRSPDTSADVFFHVRDYRGTTPPAETTRPAAADAPTPGSTPPTPCRVQWPTPPRRSGDGVDAGLGGAAGMGLLGGPTPMVGVGGGPGRQPPDVS